MATACAHLPRSCAADGLGFGAHGSGGAGEGTSGRRRSSRAVVALITTQPSTCSAAPTRAGRSSCARRWM
jgi:hypothetical protein